MKITETPAFVCSHVFEKPDAVLVVLHDGGDWQLLCGGEHPEDEIPSVVGMQHLLKADPSIQQVLDLPSGWEAERTAANAPWVRRRL